MLAVVHHEQELTIAQRVEKGVADRSLRAVPDANGGRDRLRQEIGRRQRRQVHQPYAVSKDVHEARCQTDRQPRLSNTASAGQRYQPR